VRPPDGLLEVGVVEDHKRRFTSRLERDVLEVHARHLHNLAARGRGAGEGHFVDAEVLCDGGAGDATVAVEDVDDAGREAGFFNQVREDEDREGGLLGGFHYDGVAACERRAELPSCHC